MGVAAAVMRDDYALFPGIDTVPVCSFKVHKHLVQFETEDILFCFLVESTDRHLCAMSSSIIIRLCVDVPGHGSDLEFSYNSAAIQYRTSISTSKLLLRVLFSTLPLSYD